MSRKRLLPWVGIALSLATLLLFPGCSSRKSFRNDVDNVDARLDSTAAAVEDVEQGMHEVRGSVADLEDDVASQERRHDTLEQQLAEFDTRIDSAARSTLDREGRIEEMLEDQSVEIRREISDVREQMNQTTAIPDREPAPAAQPRELHYVVSAPPSLVKNHTGFVEFRGSRKLTAALFEDLYRPPGESPPQPEARRTRSEIPRFVSVRLVAQRNLDWQVSEVEDVWFDLDEDEDPVRALRRTWEIVPQRAGTLAMSLQILATHDESGAGPVIWDEEFFQIEVSEDLIEYAEVLKTGFRDTITKSMATWAITFLAGFLMSHFGFRGFAAVKKKD